MKPRLGAVGEVVTTTGVVRQCTVVEVLPGGAFRVQVGPVLRVEFAGMRVDFGPVLPTSAQLERRADLVEADHG